MNHDASDQPAPADANPSVPVGGGPDGDVGVQSSSPLLQHAQQPPACPAWADALMELLQRHRSYRSPSALPLHLLLAELDGWLLLDRAKPWSEKGTRKQLQAEVHATRLNLGPAVAAALGSDLDTYFHRVPLLLAQDAPDREKRDQLAAQGQHLRVRLASALLVRAAWQDLLRAAADPQPRPESVHSALTALRGQLADAGHDADQRLAIAAGILGGTTFALDQAFSALGLMQPRPKFRRRSWFDLTWPVREELAARWLAYPARHGQCVVWLAYRGQLHTPMLTSSVSAAFYPLRWVLENGPALASQLATAPTVEGALGRRDLNDMPVQTAHLAELDQYEDLDEIAPSPDTPTCLVRIDLETHAVEQALTEGRQRADEIIAVAASDADVHAWKPLGWERLLVDGHRYWARNYAPQDQLRERIDLEGVGALRLQHALTEDASRLGDTLTSQRLPPELGEVRRSMDEARHGRPATAIVAYGRVLEFAAAAAGLGGYANLEDDLRSSWQYSHWNAALLNALSYCLHDRHSRAHVDPQIAAAICTSTENGETYHLEAAWTHRRQLLQAVTDDLESRRLERLLNSINDAGQHLDLLDAFGVEYDVLTLRRRRVRNALTHGNPAHPDVIASVVPHATYLAQASQSFMLNAYLKNTTVSTVVSAHTAQNRQVMDGLRDGHSMLSQWTDQT